MTTTLAPLCPDLKPAGPQADLDRQFHDIAKNFAVVDTSTAQMPKRKRITVMLDLPHLKKYGREPTRELVYGCNFKVSVGDLVSCPPTPRGKNKWTTGMVVALDGGHYRGAVKFVKKIRSAKPEKEG